MQWYFGLLSEFASTNHINIIYSLQSMNEEQKEGNIDLLQFCIVLTWSNYEKSWLLIYVRTCTFRHMGNRSHIFYFASVFLLDRLLSSTLYSYLLLTWLLSLTARLLISQQYRISSVLPFSPTLTVPYNIGFASTDSMRSINLARLNWNHSSLQLLTLLVYLDRRQFSNWLLY